MKNPSEPDSTTIKSDRDARGETEAFRARWLTRFGFSRRRWKSEARAELRTHPFVERETILRLLNALFSDVSAAADEPKIRPACETFGWLCFQAWQSSSHFPAFAENHATFLLHEIRRRKITPFTNWICLTLQSESGACGFHNLVLQNSEIIRVSEEWLRDGHFTPFNRAEVKCSEFERRLREQACFKKDWAKLKTLFPAETASHNILHRSLIPERNWVRHDGVGFGTRADRFQAALDLICWKYCLWGICEGKPLLLYPSVVVTPHGTQIFIPAYFSFDPRRDLDLGLIARLHRARGVSRQGQAFAGARKDFDRNSRRAASADAEARAKRLRGDKRYLYVVNALGMYDSGDYRVVRKLIAAGRKQTGHSTHP